MRKQASLIGSLGERTPFYGFQTPPEIKAMLAIKKALNLEKNEWKNILNFVNQYLLTQDFNDEHFLELVNSVSLNEQETKCVFGAVVVVVRCVLRTPQMRREHFEEDLKALKFPEICTFILLKLLFGPNREVIDKSALEARVSLPRLVAFKWRVDVTISNTILQRVLTPTVLGELQLTNGKTAFFEMSIAKFQQLRFYVAYILREMSEIEKQHDALKIA